MDLLRYLPIAYPQALALGALLVWLYVKRLRRHSLWRLGALVAAVLLLCYPVLRLPTRAFDLYILADRSRSISDEGRAKQAEILDLVGRRLEPGDRLGIVSFNERSYVEQAPASQGAVQSFAIPYSPDASDLTEGLATILSMADPDRPARVLVLSDGEYTGQSLLREAQVAARRGIPVYYRGLKRAGYFNLAVRDVDLPGKILQREPFRVAFRVQATAATPGRYRLSRNGRIVGAETAEGWRDFDYRQGDNTLTFNDAIETPGIYSYKLEVESVPREAETVREDNSAERFVKVVGERPVLVVNETGAPDNVTRVLAAGGLECHVVAVGSLRMSLNQLTGYKGIVLNNASLLTLPLSQIEALRDFVLQEGGGLLVTGGNRSFAKGGYYLSALDPILPVSLEDRQQSRKTATAFSIVMDRSGSMAIKTPSGQQKIQLAGEAVAECIRLMSPVDSVSVIPVDSAAHILIPQSDVRDPAGMISEVLRIESMGGGIFVYTGLVAATSQIVQAKQFNKHVLLFADADDSEEPGEYKKLMEDFVKAGITVSVVGLGTEHDSTADFLKDIAERGKGSIYFTNDAAQLTQFFTADTITYTRNSFIEDAAPMATTVAARTIAPDQTWKGFTSAHYNLLFKRPEANVAIQTADDDRAPVLAFWQRGLGRVASIALDTAGPFADQAQYGDIVLGAARWIMGAGVEDSFQVRVRYEGNYAHIRMEVSDEERDRIGAASLQLFTPEGATLNKPLQWESHNRLSAVVKLDQVGAYRGAIQVAGRTLRTDPMSIPVSPEFLHDREPDFGPRTLAQMAGLTGGREVLDVRDLFQRTTRTTAERPIVYPLLLALLAFLILDVAEDRFGMLPVLRRWGSNAWAFAGGTVRRLIPAAQRPGDAGARGVPSGAALRPARGSQSQGKPLATTDAPAVARPSAEETLPNPTGNSSDGGKTPTSASTRTDSAPAPSSSEPRPDADAGGMDYLSRSRDKSRRRFGKR